MSACAIVARWAMLFLPADMNNMVDRMGDSLRGEPLRWNAPALATFALCLAAVALASWLAVRLAGFQDWRVRCNSPARLFLVLCRAHQLRWKDRWLLWRLVKQRRLADPARLFLEPSLFDGARLPAGMTRYAGRLETIRKRLFAGLTPGGSSTLEAKDRRRPGDAPGRRPSMPALPEADSGRVGFPRTSLPKLDVPPWIGGSPADIPASQGGPGARA